MFKRFAAVVAAGVLVATGLATGPAHATTDPRPRATVPSACAPLSLVNPTRWGAEFGYRVNRHRTVAPVTVPGRSAIRRNLRPRYGAGELTVQWWVRWHDAKAKAAAVRAAKNELREANRKQAAAQSALNAALGEVNEYKAAHPTPPLPLTADELERLKGRLTDNDVVNNADLKADVQARIDVLTPYLDTEGDLKVATNAVSAARTKLDEVKAAKYWTPWRRGVVRVPECVTSTPAPTPTDEPTATPTPTEEPSEEPTETPSEEPSETPSEEPAKPTPTVTQTQTITRTVVVNNIPVPSRVDTGFGGLAR